MVQSPAPPSSDAAALLPRRNWHPGNHAALQAFLAQLAQRPPAEPPPVAVFDWDNTCIFNDIGDATLRYQLEHLQLRLPPDELEDLFFADIPTLAGPQGTSIAMPAIRHDICSSYAALWPHMQAGRGSDMRGSTAHADFVSKFGVLYGAIEADHRLGAATAYAWLLRLFSHYTDAEAAALGHAAWQMAAAEPLGGGFTQSATAGETGVMRYVYATHIAMQPEMADLIAALQQVGVRVCVVSASYQPLVRAAADRAGVGIVPEHIYGMRQPGSLLGGRTYPLTYRRGKVDAIDLCIGQEPLLVAGDANTDYEMLTHYPSTQIRLVVHRHIEGPITKLHRLALLPQVQAHAGGRLLLQGRDEGRGGFWPQQLSRQFMLETP